MAFLVTVVFSCIYAWQAHWSGDLWRCLYLASGGIAFAALAFIPLLLPFFIWMAWRKMAAARMWFRWMVMILAAMLGFAVHLVLMVDVIMLHLFGYHLNGLVVNLLLTPGGFESMGLDWHTMLPAGCIVGFLLALELLIAWWSLVSRHGERIATYLAKNNRGGWMALSAAVVCLVLALGCCGMADFKAYVPVMEALDTYPFLPNVRMRHFLRALGMKENPRRHQISFQEDGRHASLNYPASPVERRPHDKVNIVWLVGESLRADMLTQEIMPNTWNLARRGWRFMLHFSGGNGTRPGMFSMFYGLYANNWDAFLRTTRSPLVMDWCRDDGAAFLCQTSAKFTYPEFDRTIFAGIRHEDMREFGNGEAWKRDIDNTDSATEFILRQNGDSPFFLFCFFECTHAPYSFPEEEVLRADYLHHINYATVSEKDAAKLYNRSVNAAHHLDGQLGRIFKALEEAGVLDDTIVIVTGDHGEEFYEKMAKEILPNFRLGRLLQEMFGKQDFIGRGGDFRHEYLVVRVMELLGAP